MFKSTMSAVGLVLAVVGSASAQAAVTFNTVGNSAINGTHANSVILTGDDGTTKMRASAWSIKGTTIYDSYLGVFGSGFGATSGDDGNGSNNTHTLDNETRNDFVLLQFNTSVSLDSAVFKTFSVLGKSKDSDATIAFGTTALNWKTQPALNGANLATLSNFFSSSFTSLGNGAGGMRTFNPGGYGNIWLVGADFVNHDRTIDGFKLSALKVSTPAVPEPATWAMLVAGFGLVGYSVRKRPRVALRYA